MFFACFYGFFVPNARLHFADMSAAHHQHTQAALTNATTDGQRHKVEEVERPFLGSAQNYTCLELTIQETSRVNPIAMQLTGGIVIGVKLKKPYPASEEPKLIAYRCITFPSETRRNAMKYDDPTTNVTSTIRLLIMGKAYVKDLGSVAPPHSPDAKTRDEMMEKLREELFQNPTCCGMVMRSMVMCDNSPD